MIKRLVKELLYMKVDMTVRFWTCIKYLSV